MNEVVGRLVVKEEFPLRLVKRKIWYLWWRHANVQIKACSWSQALKSLDDSQAASPIMTWNFIWWSEKMWTSASYYDHTELIIDRHRINTIEVQLSLNGASFPPSNCLHQSPLPPPSRLLVWCVIHDSAILCWALSIFSADSWEWKWKRKFLRFPSALMYARRGNVGKAFPQNEGGEKAIFAIFRLPQSHPTKHCVASDEQQRGH